MGLTGKVQALKLWIIVSLLTHPSQYGVLSRVSVPNPFRISAQGIRAGLPIEMSRIEIDATD